MYCKRVPALLFRTPCFACGATLTFPVFIASFYNLRTYRGRSTGDFYQIEDDVNFEQSLSAARSREGGGGIERIPEELSCIHCGAPAGVSSTNLKGLSGTEAPIETLAEAVILP